MNVMNVMNCIIVKRPERLTAPCAGFTLLALVWAPHQHSGSLPSTGDIKYVNNNNNNLIHKVR